MKDNRSAQVSTIGQIEGKVTSMGFDMDSLGHLMGLFIDLYTDAEEAVLREYATNALDSHIEARQSRPIEVTLPTAFSNYLKIQDWGIGMNYDDIVNTYSKYGASTKRDTDEQQGMLGLGCKSALTYSPQFTLIGVKDGVSTSVLISRDEGTGAGSMNTVDEHETDEPNGVTVMIPGKEFHEFADKAAKVYRWFPKGTVLVDGEEPQRVEDGLHIGDENLQVIANEKLGFRNSKHIIVMGSVAYPTRFPNVEVDYNYSVVAYVDIGSVHFTPNREGLRDTDETNFTRNTISEFFNNHKHDAIQQQVDKAGSHREAIRIVTRYQNALGMGEYIGEGYTYDGAALPSVFKLDGMLLSSHHSSKLSSVDKRGVIGAEVWHQAIWVTGWDRPSFTPTTKKKLKMWAAENGLGGHGREDDDYVGYYVMIPKGKSIKDVKQWIDPSRIISWKKDIEPLKLPRAYGYSGQTKSIPGSYFVRTGDGPIQETAGDDLDLTQPIYYVNTSSDTTSYQFVNLLNAEHGEGKWSIVELSSNRIDKFTRIVPQAVEATKFARSHFKAWRRGLTKFQKIMLSVKDEGYRNQEGFAAMDRVRVTDPDVKQWISAQNAIERGRMKSLKTRINMYQKAGVYEIPKGLPNPMDKYAFVDADDFDTTSYYAKTKDEIEHQYAYMNWAYATKQFKVAK